MWTTLQTRGRSRWRPCSSLTNCGTRCGRRHCSTSSTSRADYEHIDEYIAATSDAAIERFHAGVLFLADSGLLLVEAQLAACTDALRQTAADWAASTVGALGAWAAAPVRDRIEVIAACGHA
jgi:hypothetical protein